MKWIIRTLKPGDHIRVGRGMYYHHGVYIGDNEVIHYTGESGDSIDKPELVEVKKTSIEFFSQSGIVEIASLSFFEKLFSRSRKKRILLAVNSIGEKNYDFLNNNCETLANKCCYRCQLTSQVKDKKAL